MITNGYIRLNENSLELRNGSEEVQFVPITNLKRVYREFNDLTTYVGQTARTATEQILVFELRDGLTVKVNDTIYSQKDRDKLFEYLKNRGIQID